MTRFGAGLQTALPAALCPRACSSRDVAASASSASRSGSASSCSAPARASGRAASARAAAIRWSSCTPTCAGSSRARASRGADPAAQDILDDQAEAVRARVAAFGLYAPPSGSDAIFVATVRALVQFAAYSPSIAKRKVIVVGDAERMVPQEGADQAANAFLKLLEEPPADTTIILTSSEPGSLLPTIRSRVVSRARRAAPERRRRGISSRTDVAKARSPSWICRSSDERSHRARGRRAGHAARRHRERRSDDDRAVDARGRRRSRALTAFAPPSRFHLQERAADFRRYSTRSPSPCTRRCARRQRRATQLPASAPAARSTSSRARSCARAATSTPNWLTSAMIRSMSEL